MLTTVPTLTSEEALRQVEAHVDLRNVLRKLADADEGPGYDESRLELMATEYRRFLALQVMHPGEDIVPCKIVDEMWHRHILDTRAYAADCDALFGEFLHHYPYFGMNGPQDAQDLNDAYSATLERYQDAFGDPPADTWISRDAARCKRTACKPQKCK